MLVYINYFLFSCFFHPLFVRVVAVVVFLCGSFSFFFVGVLCGFCLFVCCFLFMSLLFFFFLSFF